jgi:hypothetical protein
MSIWIRRTSSCALKCEEAAAAGQERQMARGSPSIGNCTVHDLFHRDLAGQIVLEV